MARVHKKILGELRGKIGDVVAKVRNGKQYIASRPAKYTMSQAPHEIDKRNRFRVNGLFAKAIKGNPLLYSIWNLEKAPASNAYNKICKVNFSLCATDRPSADNLITPDGFELQIKNLNFHKDKIELELNPFNLLPGEKIIAPAMIISLFGPVKKIKEYFHIISPAEYETNGLEFTFNLSTSDLQKIKLYNNKTVFTAAIIQDEKGNIKRWSRTVVKEF